MGTSSDLTPFSPRLLLDWEQQDPTAIHRAIEGTLVFADVSGFTRLSERLARTRGKAGAEEMTDIINALFGDLLTVAALRGGEMLKYGGDAVLLFFRGEDHALRAATATIEMQQRLREIGRVVTDAGPVRLRMSVGVHSGTFDLFKVGARHLELVIAGPATTEIVRVEGVASAGEVLVSAATAALLPASVLGAVKEGGRLLRRAPGAPTTAIVPATPSPIADRFIAARVRDHLAAGLVEPEHRLATIAFLHLMGVDSMLREVGPQLVARRLDLTMEIVQDALADAGVSFLATDLAGDGTKVMAAAGAPITGDEDERCMLLALRRIVDAHPPLPVRAGVNRGHVFAAPVGPPFRQTYTTIGDVTNTAARLCAKAAEEEVLALRTVVDHARAGVRSTEREPFMAKGKAEPLVPYAVEAIEDVAEVSATARFELVGRDTELACLVRALEAAREGSGSLAELVGDMGSGKSRLVAELLDRVGDARVVMAHCEPYERATPFHPIRRVLEQLLDGDIEDCVLTRAPQLAAWIPLVAGVLDLEVDDTPETAALDPKLRLSRTAEVTVELLSALLPGPTVLVVEDLHWIDDASAAVLGRLEAAASAHPWLVCVTRRDEPSAFTASASTSSLVQLAALADADITRLVAAATGDAPLPPHRARALVERSAGNPLYLTELLATAIDDDVDAALPDSIEAVMAAQIDRLPADDRRLLRYAAILGSRFDLELLAQIADEPAIANASLASVAGRLQSLVVPEGDDRLRFRHQLIRDVAYESLPFRLRRDLHDRAGAAIERRCEADGRERPGILSLHYLHARRFDRCWRYARAAADRASQRHANREAVQLYERALVAARQLAGLDRQDIAHVWDRLAFRHALLGSLDRASEALRNARRLSRDRPVDLAKLCFRQARLAEQAGKPQSLVRWVGRGLTAIADVADPAAGVMRADLEVMRAWAMQNLGRSAEAARWATRALATAEAASNQRAVANACAVLELADAALGRPGDPTRVVRAIDVYEELGEQADLTEFATIVNNLGASAYYQGRWTDAVSLYERSRTLNEKIGSVIEAASVAFNIAEIFLDQGRLDEADQLLDQAAASWRSVGYGIGASFIASHRGRLEVHRGNPVAALELFERARIDLAQIGFTEFVLDLDARIAECLLRIGRVDEARGAAERACAQDPTGRSRSTPIFSRTLAYCAAAAGDVTLAWSTMDRSLSQAKALAASYDVALALEGLSVLATMGAEASSDVDAERRAVLAELGIAALPTPPVAAIEPAAPASIAAAAVS